jgi:hypothetical protein
MKEKYINEAYPEWMVFGAYPNGNVNLTDANSAFDAEMSAAAADAILKQHQHLYRAFVRMASAFEAASPEAFKQFWYGGGRTDVQPNQP